MWELLRKNGKDLKVLFIIVLIVIGAGIINIHLPGVYFDSAITDYLAPLALQPGVENEVAMMSHVGLPLLGGIYHGSVSMFLQMVILSFWDASVITLRVPYLLYYVCATFIVYKIIEKVTCKKTALAGAIVLSGMIYTVTLTRTQYDIMLPGVIFLLIAVYILIAKWKIFKEGEHLDADKYSFLIGLLLGLAFYDYFCFIFFFPAIMAVLLIMQKGNRVWTLLANVTGILAGSALYFVGYADSFLVNIFGTQTYTLILLIFFAVLLGGALGIPSYFFLCRKEKRKFLAAYYTVGIIGTLLIAVLAMIVIGPLFFEKLALSELNLSGVNNSVGKRLGSFFIYLYNIVSDSTCEEMINGIHTSVSPMLLVSAFALIQVIFYVLHFVKYKKMMNVAAINILNGLFVCYYVLSLPLITRMQPQHFVPFLFLIPVILFSEIGILGEMSKKNGIITKGIILFTILISIMNLYDHVKFQNILYEYEGINGYSIKYNELAEEGLNRKKEGISQLWLFAEPGFIPTFIYLTDSNVKTDILYDVSGEYSETKMKLACQYIEQGYQINIVSKENVTEICDLIDKEYSNLDYDIYRYEDGKGNWLFDRVEIGMEINDNTD